MLDKIYRTAPRSSHNKLKIYDARSYINALANRVNSGGFENTKDYYTNSEIVFCDIENIHAVRDAYRKMHDLAFMPISSPAYQESKYFTYLEQTNWLQLQSKILVSANSILDAIVNDRANILVHCTDGWDRTAILCSLVQMMLDPHFRTVQGFITIIEKDWLSFGHMFHRRLGHFNGDFKDD